METKFHLEAKTVDHLQTLVQNNLDSQQAFEQLAEHLENDPIAAYFKSLAKARAEQASELQTLLAENLQEPPTEGTYAGGMHRIWTNLRSVLGGGRQAMLSEAEAEEDRIKEAYSNALKENPASAVSDVLHRQLRAVKESHDEIRRLRDAE